jgi:hypothetical protein
MRVDEEEYGHRNWSGIPDNAIEAAEAPRILDAFARLVERLDAEG